MFYKLSNTTELLTVEAAFDAKFKYPLLYKTSPIINGLSEQLLPVITMNSLKTIDYAIWGLLPQDFKESWESFQNLTNTLNISIEQVHKLGWVEKLLNRQRCVVLVSGFFTSYIYKGEIYPFYVYQKNHQPFALAGVYSILNDGFLSVSLITRPGQNKVKRVHNMGNEFPIAISKAHFKEWLSSDLDLSEESHYSGYEPELRAHTISKEFYKNDIIFEAILEPANYEDVPFLSLI